MGIAEFLITFRETLEAALIISIIYRILVEANATKAIGSLWQGIITSIAVSIMAAWGFQAFMNGLPETYEGFIEAFTMLFAAGLLGSMIVWMAKNRNIANTLKEQTLEALNSPQIRWSIFLLVFLSVFREGIETVLFLYGITINQGSISIISGFAGCGVAILIGYLFLKGSRAIPIKMFFNISSILLILVASGLVAHGIHELEEVGVIPYEGAIWNINPPQNLDGTYPLLHEQGYIGSLAKGLFGWNGNPSLIELIGWMGTLVMTTWFWQRNISESQKETSV